MFFHPDFKVSNDVLTKYTGTNEDVAIPNGIKEIKAMAFFECKSIRSVIIPEGVTSIGGNAFEGCTNLSFVQLPKSLKEIGFHAFYGAAIRVIKIPEGVTDISAAFSNCPELQTIIIPYTVNNIDDAFHCCHSLEHVYIDNNTAITEMSGTFYKCSRIRSIILPKYITSIGNSTFSGTGLQEIDIPNGVTKIGFGAFNGCPYLKSVTIPSTVTDISEMAFTLCPNLKSIRFRGNKQQWDSINKHTRWINAEAIGVEPPEIIFTNEVLPPPPKRPVTSTLVNNTQSTPKLSNAERFCIPTTEDSTIKCMHEFFNMCIILSDRFRAPDVVISIDTVSSVTSVYATAMFDKASIIYQAYTYRKNNNQLMLKSTYDKYIAPHVSKIKSIKLFQTFDEFIELLQKGVDRYEYVLLSDRGIVFYKRIGKIRMTRNKAPMLLKNLFNECKTKYYSVMESDYMELGKNLFGISRIVPKAFTVRIESLEESFNRIQNIIKYN